MGNLWETYGGSPREAYEKPMGSQCVTHRFYVPGANEAQGLACIQLFSIHLPSYVGPMGFQWLSTGLAVHVEKQ